MQPEGRPLFTVKTSTAGSRTDAHLHGELDMATAAQLATVLDELRRSGSRLVVLDMARLDFLGAAGLSVLVRADSAFRADGGRIVLAGLTPIVRRILAITHLDAVLTIE
ncbi:MAG: STAS domain-containing protein [Pseudonocardia sp.]